VANKKDFGCRNKNLCEKLQKENEYFDWVVTVAFYSSIHFLEDKCLPTTVNNLHCKNINEVKGALKIRYGRHAARRHLISQKTNYNISSFYNWLDDQSRNSRYTTYLVNKSKGEKAIEYLNKIFEFCYPNP
jgi:hypothetical protein